MYNKYRAKKTKYNGKTYASKKEAQRAQELDLLVRSGDITDLKEQVKFPIDIAGKQVFTYIADFMYFDKLLNKVVIEDVKGFQTAIFRLKKKCVEAYYSIEITIV